MINETFISIRLYYIVDIRGSPTHTHRDTKAQSERDKILIRNTTQRHLGNQDDNDVGNEDK